MKSHKIQVMDMKITADQSLFETVPELKFGILHYNRISTSDAPGMLKGRIGYFYQEMQIDLDDKSLTDIPGIAEWRKVWKAFGKDPGRYRPSAEALIRRVKKGQVPGEINLGVDLNNFFSVREGIPCGLYDLAAVKGDVAIRKGSVEDEYEGLNGRVNNLENLLLTSDEQGPFGSPFVDSGRTAVTEQTTEALHVLYLQPSMTIEEAEVLLEETGIFFTSATGGGFTGEILHAGNRSAEI
jgi:DNA/RNA-binding domain of Phe-tRNA-synthetase-like protein